jgi:hypothetical protein
MTRSFPLLVSSLALAPLALSGCYAPPPRVSELGGPPGVLSSVMVESEFWSRDDELPALDACGAPVRKVALAEVSVELVTHKWVAPLPGAALLDPSMYNDVGIVVQLLGLGRRLTSYGEELEAAIPARVHAALVAGLRARGLEVVAPEVVRATRAYARYAALDRDTSSVARYFNPVGHDTGRIRSFDVVPGPGLRVIDGAVEDEDDEGAPGVDRALLDETGADVVMRARFRVGLHEGRLAVESGSTVAVTGRGFQGTLASQRSLTSDAEVAEVGFLPVRGLDYAIDPSALRAALDVVFPVYRDLALDALGLPATRTARLAASRAP